MGGWRKFWGVFLHHEGHEETRSGDYTEGSFLHHDGTKSLARRSRNQSSRMWSVCESLARISPAETQRGRGAEKEGIEKNRKRRYHRFDVRLRVIGGYATAK